MSKKQRIKKTVEQELDEMNQMDEFLKTSLRSFQFKVSCKFKNKKQKELYQTIMDNRITFCSGAAGTGKTLISLMAGLDCLKDKEKNIGQIILTKPIVEIGKSVGAMPGDLIEKTIPYFTHFYDNLIKVIGSYQTNYLKENNFIKETILNFVRGSTFGQYSSNGEPVGSFCIFDESQNCTITEMKTFISRMGENSKLVILGDIDQIDLKLQRGERCGLEDAIARFQGINGIGFVEFSEDDIVRDPFLIEIMKRYKVNPVV